MEELIIKKRDGFSLSTEEIHQLMKNIYKGEVPDYQLSALLMAIYFQGMNSEELFSWTKGMVETGDQVDLSSVKGTLVDKHSTGGVGDKVSLVLAPLMAACGLKMAKMSGRGLGHTGGTIDKLESIPGLTTELTQRQFLEEVDTIGLSIIQQSLKLAPIDKKLYALRDVTGTVESIPLIAGSIVSKKIASGSRTIVFDVKIGEGAFMKNLEDGESLALTMKSLVSSFGGQSQGILTKMDEPLGKGIGNSLEVMESIDALRGQGPEDLMEVVFALGSSLLLMTDKVSTKEEAVLMLQSALDSGEALVRFRELIDFQGGDTRIIEDFNRFPKASNVLEIKSIDEGYVASIDGHQLGVLAMHLGAGRVQLNDVIDGSAGLCLEKKVGDYVKKGDRMGWAYWNHASLDKNQILTEFRKSYMFSDIEVKKTSKIIKCL